MIRQSPSRKFVNWFSKIVPFLLTTTYSWVYHTICKLILYCLIHWRRKVVEGLLVYGCWACSSWGSCMCLINWVFIKHSISVMEPLMQQLFLDFCCQIRMFTIYIRASLTLVIECYQNKTAQICLSISDAWLCTIYKCQVYALW